MTNSDKSSPVSRKSRFHFYPWKDQEFIILLVNGFLLLLVVICSGKLIFEMLFGTFSKADQNDLWIAIVLTITAYFYSILLAYGSVRTFEKSDKITNVTQILRFYSVIYFIGFGVIYWIVILKLSEQDYLASKYRYMQYIIILVVCFLAVRFFATIPKIQDIWILTAVIFISNLIHATSIVIQYIFQGGNEFAYFFRDIAVLAGMAIVALYTLFGRWKVQ